MVVESPTLSVIVPVYNEEPINLRHLVVRLQQVMQQNEPHTDYELIFIDDGSRSKTRNYLKEIQQQSPEVKLVFLSRNFGEQAAITAGLFHASGEVVVNMDSDLQDPPEMLPQMLTYWRDGYDVVFTRQVLRHEPLSKTLPAYIFYRVLNCLADIEITPDAGEFRLLNRKVVESLKAMPEKSRFLRGQVPWVGFASKEIPFERDGRAAGQTSYTFSRLVKLAMQAIISFSFKPLFAISWLGVLVFFLSIAVAIVASFNPGLLSEVSTTNVLILALFVLVSLQFLSLGIIAIYQSQQISEARGRPVFLVSERLGFAGNSLEHPLHSSNNLCSMH